MRSAGGGLYLFLNNRFGRRDRLGLYDETVHFYFVYGYLREHGWSPKEALTAAWGSQYPDTGRWTATPGRHLGETLWKMCTTHGAEKHEWQFNIMTFHNFNGLDATQLEKYREGIRTQLALAKEHKCYFRVGLLLHALGDTYAHVQLSGVSYANGNRWGHASDGTAPDDVQGVAVIPDGYRLFGEKQFRHGFVQDVGLTQLEMDVSKEPDVSFTMENLLNELYAENTFWGSLLSWNLTQSFYKNHDSAGLFLNYANQFGGLNDVNPDSPKVNRMIGVYSPECMEIETYNVREILRQCLVDAGWSWPK